MARDTQDIISQLLRFEDRKQANSHFCGSEESSH